MVWKTPVSPRHMARLFRLLCLVVFSALFLGVSDNPSIAQSQEATFPTTVGVDVNVRYDAFAERYEFTSPEIAIRNNGVSGAAFVAAVYSQGELDAIYVTGFVHYLGGWRRFNQAIARGGRAIEADFGNRQVVSCGRARNSDCILKESFDLQISAERAAEIAESGIVRIQISAGGQHAFIVPIRLSYFEAVEEVSSTLIQVAQEKSDQ